MKNKLFKLLPILLLVFFASCDQAPIFYDIAKEVELAEPTVQGDVHSIVKLGSKLYTQNNKIFVKDLKNTQGWTTTVKPPEDGRVVRLASDETYLYALTAEQTENKDGIQKFKFVLSSSLVGTGTWTEVESKEITVEDDDDSTTGIVLFDNGVNGDATSTTGRNAYFRIDGIVYNLTSGAKGTAVSTNGAGDATLAAANLSGTDYFSDTLAFCSDGVDTLYKANAEDETIESSTDNTNWENPVTIENATVMAYAKDKLYVGTTSGLEQVTLDTEGGTPESASNLGSNAEATLGSKYILSIATFGDADGDAIYAGAISLTSSKNHAHALWGYYQSRGNWNYE